jgi:hypothetical protein
MQIMEFKMPPVLYNERGQLRTVGFELEYGGVDLDTTAGIIMELYGGIHYRESNFKQEVRDTELGTFHLKMDARALTDKTYEETLERFGIDAGNEKVEGLVERFAAILVPYELGLPPRPLDQLYKVEQLREALFINEAKGTKASPILAYATHINAEIPVQNAETVLRYMRAFILLYPWLWDKAEIAIRRRLASYINPYPDEYVQLILAPGYKPDTRQLIDDYHNSNPDRNRALDMYPLLSCLDKEHVASKGDIGNVKPRPTFHYRLPNSLVDDPAWSLAKEWNQWVIIEKLASSPDKITSVSEDYLRLESKTRIGFFQQWVSRTEEWIEC